MMIKNGQMSPRRKSKQDRNDRKRNQLAPTMLANDFKNHPLPAFFHRTTIPVCRERKGNEHANRIKWNQPFRRSLKMNNRTIEPAASVMIPLE